MEKIIFLTLVITITSNKIYGQEIFPLYANNPTWNICIMSAYTTGFEPQPVYSINYSYEKDTIINSLSYSKIKNTYGLIFTGFIRNENKKVYISINDSTEFIMYNFSLNLYDTIYCPFPYFNTTGNISNWRYDLKGIKYYVIEIDSLLIDSTYRKVIKLQTDYPQGTPPQLLYNMIWIEGIGSIENPLYSIFGFGDCYWSFDHLLINEDTIYKKEYPIGVISLCDMVEGFEGINKENSITIYPNPFTDYFFINHNITEKNLEVNIVDNNGHLILNKKISSSTNPINFPFSRGIYYIEILSGKTILKRDKLIKIK